MIRRLTIIGVGLIGGSLARALREAGACEEVVGSSRSSGHLVRAAELGVIDRYDTDPARAVEGADMVMVAVPLGSMAQVFGAMAPGLAPDAVITDAGSAKVSVIEAARTAFGAVPARLVPGHPIAGTEQSGVEASYSTLFQRRRVILTPTPETDQDALSKVRAMWEHTGAEVVVMEPAHHDEVLAATSHLPHLLAYGLVDALARMEDRAEIFRYAAGGFRDFTRIASSDPVMWHDICLSNREAILDVLGRFQDDLDKLTVAIRGNDSAFIKEVFTRAKQARDRFTEMEDGIIPAE